MGRVRSVSASRSVSPWVWAGLIWIGGITALVLGPVENSLDLVEILLALLLTALASVIGSRQPGNRIALLPQLRPRFLDVADLSFIPTS